MRHLFGASPVSLGLVHTTRIYGPYIGVHFLALFVPVYMGSVYRALVSTH